MTVPMEDYDDRYLECRDLGHAWRTLGYFYGRDSHGQVMKRRVRCVRCRMQRDDTLLGWQTKHAYTQPEDYAMPGTKRGDFKDEAVRRAKKSVFASEDVMVKALKRRRT
jgi:hypothetical protein